MTRSRLLGLAVILVGLGGLLSPTQAQDWEPEERLIVPIPDNDGFTQGVTIIIDLPDDPD